MSVTIDSLDIQIRSSAGSAAKNIEKLANAFGKLSGGSKISAVTKGLDELGDSLDKTNINLAATLSNVQNFLQGIQVAVQKISQMLDDAIQWDGIQFRFGRAFGEDAEEVLAYAEKLSDVLMINQQQFMQYSSMFGSLLSGFGMEQDKITDISVGLTELSYDIWAAYNDRYKSYEDAFEAVRSAITGEIEPIRNAGIALTEASMQEYLDSIGMASVSVENLTEAQKSEVRYAVMVNSAMSQGIVGTYAKEMDTAEGAVRTLTQQLKTLKQAFGSLFIPILQAVVPWITAFVEILTDAVFWVANLFGIDIQKISWGDATKGVDGLATGAEDANDALNGAKDAAKKLKSYTMGFDELNVINPSSDAAGGSSGAADGWGDGLDLDKLWDDSIFANASKQVDEIKEKLKDVLEFVGLIGAGFAAWKIAKSFMTALDTVKLVLKGIAGQKGADSALTLLLSPKAAETVKKLGGVLKKTKIGALLLGSGSTSIGAAAAAIAGVVAAIAAIAGGLAIVYRESANFRNGLVVIGNGIKTALAYIGDTFSMWGDAIRESLAGWIPEGVLEFFENLDIGIGDLLITLGGLLLFGPVGLVIEGVVLAIKAIGYAASDALPSVNLFGDGISEATKEKVEPFLEKMDELETSLSSLDWGNAIVTDSDLESISAKLKEVTDVIISELDSDKNEALANIHPLKGALSDEKYNELLAKIEESYNNQVQAVTDGEARINEILATASAEARAITDEEAAEIARIQEEMKTTGIKYLSESELESNLILQRLKDNASLLSAEQASEVIKHAISARDETIKAAEEQYDGILLEAQRLLDTGMINKEEYDEIVGYAESAKDDAISAAETQYDEILKTAQTQMGEYAKYIDTETGEIKSKWTVFCEDTSEDFSEAWTNIKESWTFFKDEFGKGWDNFWGDVGDILSETWDNITTGWDGFKKSFGEGWDKFWNGAGETVDGMINAVITGIESGLNWCITALNSLSWEVPDWVPWAGGKTFGFNIQPISLGRVDLFAGGGFPDMGQMFIAREAGPELVGNIRGKTAVANNDQIVEAVSQGVYAAVVAAMNATNGNQSQNVNVYLDGKQIYASVKKTESERGRTLMGNQLGYVY